MPEPSKLPSDCNMLYHYEEAATLVNVCKNRKYKSLQWDYDYICLNYCIDRYKCVSCERGNQKEKYYIFLWNKECQYPLLNHK